jgi:hypothetical protein
VRSALVFCATVRGAQLLHETLRELGAAPTVLHSAMAQKARAAPLWPTAWPAGCPRSPPAARAMQAAAIPAALRARKRQRAAWRATF